MAKFCTNCGTQLPEDQKFCTNCGMALNNEETAVRQSGNSTAPNQAVSETAAASTPVTPVQPKAKAQKTTYQQSQPTPAQPAYQQPQASPVQPAYQPQPQYGVDAEPPKGSKYEPISTLGYIGIMLLMCIPIVGQLLIILWALGGCKKVNQRNLARASLIMMIAGILFSLFIGMTIKRKIDKTIDQFERQTGISLSGDSNEDSSGGLAGLISTILSGGENIEVSGNNGSGNSNNYNNNGNTYNSGNNNSSGNSGNSGSSGSSDISSEDLAILEQLLGEDGLEAIGGLEGLENLEGLEGLEALEGLEGLEGLGDLTDLEGLSQIIGMLGGATGGSGSGNSNSKETAADISNYLENVEKINKDAEKANDGWPKTLREYPGGTVNSVTSYRTEITNTTEEEVLAWIESLKKDGFKYQDFYDFGMTEEDMLSMTSWWGTDGDIYVSVSFSDGKVTVDHVNELPNIEDYFK